MRYKQRGIPVSEQIKGQAAENFFFRAMQSFRGKNDWPDWLLDVRKATEEEDLEGIDFIARTKDVGEIFVQIKSSVAGTRKYVQIHGHKSREVCILVSSNPEENLLSVFKRSRKMLSKARQNRLNKIPKSITMSPKYRSTPTA